MQNIRAPFDIADYQSNPDKYALFRTATVATNALDNPKLKAGTIVSIRFFGVADNLKHGPMPLYDVFVDGKLETQLFAAALGDFVL